MTIESRVLTVLAASDVLTVILLVMQSDRTETEAELPSHPSNKLLSTR